MRAGAVASLSPPSNRSWETAVLGGALKMSPSEQGRKDGKASIPPTSTLLRDAVQLPRSAVEEGLHPLEEGALWLADGRDGPKAGGGRSSYKATKPFRLFWCMVRSVRSGYPTEHLHTKWGPIPIPIPIPGT